MPKGDEIVKKSERPSYFVPGYRAVREALISDQPRGREIWISKGRRGAKTEEVLALAESRGVPVRFREGTDFDRILPGINHQGMALRTDQYVYADLERLMDRARRAPGHALFLAADHITDEGNLGALLRVSAFFGAHGLILPRDRSAGVTARVCKRSSGGYVHVPVSRVVNLGRTLETFKDGGFWIIGAAEEAPEGLYGFDWRRDLVLVLGSEGKGLSRLIRERCDALVRIPSQGPVGSLNVSVAAGILLSEMVRQRKASKQ